ncbi:heme peroxidase [Russula ochroleuca]|uniref:Heme peroxidase n=1 Tax=Russula ochroleuca TaxID=152965 RepID=A0A9P5MP55_9AGAM|nr:heme peroxidase [Russula ochroleuca]KAF8467603.1 heme peroxidase [Russula ochroleuca]
MDEINSSKQVSVRDFTTNAVQVLDPGQDVMQWTFGGLSRDSGHFRDADLAKILRNVTAAPASAFKACRTPEVLRIIEILSIEQGQKWGVCTLNEFCKFICLKPYATFWDWNEDEEIAAAAKALYHDIDNLELHVGLQAEQAKTLWPGTGLCLGFTISRAILSDAVALTRGDHFLTVDYTHMQLLSILS